MRATRLPTIIGCFALFSAAGFALQQATVSAGQARAFVATASDNAPASTPVPAATCPPRHPLAIAFTDNVDASTLHLQLPWGKPGDPEGRMVEDYGAYNGTTIRKHLPVHDVTTGSLLELYGHNAVDIVLDSGTPLYAVTSGTVYRITNWTVPGFPTGWASVVVSDVLKDDQGVAIGFLYGHVREFDVRNGEHVVAGALIAKSGGDPDDPGAGFSDMANVHFEVIESPKPLTAHAGTVNPHQFLENLYADAALTGQHPAC
jgi:murein DD-endopeptidase MepM/ murein hydrolase activator NlpD